MCDFLQFSCLICLVSGDAGSAGEDAPGSQRVARRAGSVLPLTSRLRCPVPWRKKMGADAGILHELRKIIGIDGDLLPLRITLNTERMISKKEAVRTAATVDYVPGSVGLVGSGPCERESETIS
jgi:hypothetical protein